MSRALPARARVVIVGGGFAGAATACFLARSGLRDVVLLEREVACGLHATGRNAALGRQLAGQERFTDYTVTGCAFLRRPPADFTPGPLLTPWGSMLLASEPATLARLQRRATARDLRCHVLSPAAVRERWPLLSQTPLVGALAFPDDGIIDIHALLRAYLDGACSAGGRIFTSCGVRGAAEVPNGVRISTDLGDIEAEVLVVAAGAWADDVGRACGAPALGLEAVRRHLFVSEPVAGLPADLPFAWHVDEPFYLRPEGGGLLMSGCDATPMPACEPAVDPEATAALADRLQRLAPHVTRYGVARAWACLRTFPTGERFGPVIGFAPRAPRLFHVAGLGGHGATGSPAIGREAARLILARLQP